MVEVGSMSIGGSINTQNIQAGLGRIRKGFDQVKSRVQSSAADFERLASSASNVAGQLGAIGGAGLAAITALASKSPALAPQFAKLKVETLKLGNVLGEALAPRFEQLNGLISSFTGFLQDNPGFSKFLTDATILAASLGATSVAIKTISGVLKSIGGVLGASVAGATVGGVLLKLGTIGGIAAGLAGSAKKIGEGLTQQFSPPGPTQTPPAEEGFRFGSNAPPSAQDLRLLGGNMNRPGFGSLPQSTPELMIDPNTGERRIKTQADRTADIIDYTVQQLNQRDTTFAIVNGVSR